MFFISEACEARVEATGDVNSTISAPPVQDLKYGLSGLYLSPPCIIGAKGVERVLTPDLSERERLGMAQSAQVLRDAAAQLPALPDA